LRKPDPSARHTLARSDGAARTPVTPGKDRDRGSAGSQNHLLRGRESPFSTASKKPFPDLEKQPKNPIYSRA
jgi:hypothetical protein